MKQFESLKCSLSLMNSKYCLALVYGAYSFAEKKIIILFWCGQSGLSDTLVHVHDICSPSFKILF